MRRGTQRAFCSGVPFTTIGCGPNRLMCTVEAAAIPPPWLATSCIMIAASVTPRPAPPYSSGMVMPSHPASAIARWNSRGKDAVLVALEPIVVAELRDDGAHAFADRVAFVLGRQGSAFAHRLALSPPFRSTPASFAPPSDAGCRSSCRRARACRRRDWRRRLRRCGARGRFPLPRACSSG